MPGLDGTHLFWLSLTDDVATLMWSDTEHGYGGDDLCVQSGSVPAHILWMDKVQFEEWCTERRRGIKAKEAAVAKERYLLALAKEREIYEALRQKYGEP